jgi:hypothetical protein
VVHSGIVVQVAPVESGVLLLPHYRQTFVAGATFTSIASQSVKAPTETHLVPLSVDSFQSERANPV